MKEDWLPNDNIGEVSVCDEETAVVENTQDAACLGAAIIAGYGAGAWDSIEETARKFAKVDQIYEPNPENRQVYDRLLKKYDLFIEATRGYTEELSRLD